MSIAAYIREIGRGKDGARSLDRHQAHDLMSQVLDGRVTDFEVGAFAVAMRIKGESPEELAGFLQAVTERCVPIEPPRPAVVLPSYNGSRKLPNLTPLLALMLARAGVPVLVHGPATDPQRVTTHDIFRHLGMTIAEAGSGSPASACHAAWSRGEPVFFPIDLLNPALARLLHLRRVIGLRNPGHTIAKLLDPCRGAPALRVVNHTHPEYGALLAEFLQATQANALLMRGCEGEPVADPRRLPRMELFLQGQPDAARSAQARGGVLTELPALPKENDAAATASYIKSVLDGEAPAPEPLLRQCELLAQGVGLISVQDPPRVTA